MVPSAKKSSANFIQNVLSIILLFFVTTTVQFYVFHIENESVVVK